jgi:Holliday junction resolvasome RuvABC endonuclease subunit
MLGLDPGTNNFAFSVVEGNGKKFNILEHGRFAP